jgi:hypothetical protein
LFFLSLSLSFLFSREKQQQQKDKEFLWEGLKNIDDTMFRLTHGDTMNRAVQERAKELFQKAFYRQMEQKKGNLVMKRNGGQKTTQGGIRKKFSKRKQYVVSCIWKALEEQDNKAWDVASAPTLFLILKFFSPFFFPFLQH